MEFVEFFKHVLHRVLHALCLQLGKLANLPDVPDGIPVLCDLPDLLQVVYVLDKANYTTITSSNTSTFLHHRSHSTHCGITSHVAESAIGQ